MKRDRNYILSLTNSTFNGTVAGERCPMERTNANDFRARLKEWMETARTEPVKITRKSGESFVLVNSEEFEDMQVELANLRGLAQGLSDAVQGRTKLASSDSTDDAVARAKDKVLGKRGKKAVG